MDVITETQDASLALERQDSSPVIQKALYLPDILTFLFDFCSNATLASSAQVCRSWSTEALRRLWRQLEDPLPLFRLLGGIEIEKNRGWANSAYIYVSP